jgi:hypothetical protein
MLMTERLPSGAYKYPSHHWGALAQNPMLEIGATGQVWIDAVRAAWMRSGGTEESFALVFPDLVAEEAEGKKGS